MKKTFLAAAALLLVVVCVAISQTPASPKYQVVFQMTEPEGQAWDLLVAHVNNLRSALSKDGFWPLYSFTTAGSELVMSCGAFGSR